jgi:serine/threonine protein kinase
LTVGSTHFRAPEANQAVYNSLCDVWSFGIIIGELCKVGEKIAYVRCSFPSSSSLLRLTPNPSSSSPFGELCKVGKKNSVCVMLPPPLPPPCFV